ncbi:unnamed protein product [Prorocentrum cordatum]|uniref:Uncharacterized protein n=1 Tax=Prorocentrum cordatum TaxID=2364126 RepID=A0ABN9UJD8_9DINO|nr:unnamed protein product [Polarella glacialis]
MEKACKASRTSVSGSRLDATLNSAESLGLQPHQEAYQQISVPKTWIGTSMGKLAVHPPLPAPPPVAVALPTCFQLVPGATTATVVAKDSKRVGKSKMHRDLGSSTA